MIGQGKKVGVWLNHKPDESKSDVKDFTGKVVEVHSGDCMTIERDEDFKMIKIFLSSLKAPKISLEVQESYGWESKESLRKLSIGKKVKVCVEYAKDV
jgi:hypothetical protein